MSHESRFANWARAGLLLAGLLISPLAAAQANPKAEAESCRECHEAEVDHYFKTQHGQAGLKGTPATKQGCGTCHGDASEHVKSKGGKLGAMIPLSPKKASAEQRSEVCLSCHQGGRQLTFWDMGRHKKNDVGCNNCHNVHGQSRRAEAAYYRTTSLPIQHEEYNCLNCHKEIRNLINRQSHHPLPEGKVKCSDCHNPHGSLNHAMLKHDTVNQQCYSCHAEKRGPYVWEHPPVEDNCLTCHNPHGSKAQRMLNERVPILCEDCHGAGRHNGTLYDGNTGFTGTAAATTRAKMVGRACLNCHNNIHGSNAGSAGGRRFIR